MRAVLLTALTAGLAWGAAPPAAFTAGQRAALAGRPWVGVWPKTLEIELAVYGPWHRQVERTAERLGDTHRSAGEWAEEAACRRVVIAARVRLDGEGHWRVADARLELAESLAQPGRTAAQRAALSRAATLYRQAMRLHGEGKAAIALPPLKEALKLYKGVLGTRHPDYVNSLNNLAALLQAMGDHKAALPLFKEAVALHKGVLGARHPSYASGLNNLALLLKEMGDHKAALPLFKEAVKLHKEVLGTRNPHYAASLDNLAGLLQEVGDHKGALPLYKEAVALTKGVLGARDPSYATSLNNLALLLRDMGDHKGALPLLKEALAVRKEVLGTRHPHYATSLNNLALLLKETGDHKGALPLYKEALALIKVVPGTRHPSYASGLYNLAALLKELGDHKGALPLYREALALTKEVLGTGHPYYARGLNGLASLLAEMGDHRGALPVHKEALTLQKEVLGVRHPDYAMSLNNLALLLWAMGDQKGALEMMEGSLELAASLLRDNASVQSDRQQLANLALLRHRLDNRLLMEDGEGHATAATHVLAWKGQVLLRQQRRRLFLSLDADPVTRAASERLQDVTRRLVALRSSPAATREKLDALREEQDDAQAALSRLSAAFREEARGAVTPEALAKSLPEDAVLVDYLFYWGRLSAFVHRRGQKPVRVDLGKAEPILSAVREWRPLLTRGKTGTARGAALKRLVWLPLERHLEGAKVVLVSPDGPLGTVPFAALPGRKSGAYLIEDVAVAVVPVPSAIPEVLRPVVEKERLPASLLAVGGVDYDGAPAAPADTRGAPLGISRDWAALPGTAGEAASVAGSFAVRFKAEAVSLSGRKASSGAVRAGLAKTRYAHLATHGYFAPETVKSALDLGGKRPEDGPPTGWDPLLLSGLVFAGANREPKPGEEDGILTAPEVSEMDLTRLELAVLSACQTGLGKVADGEGLLGMQRAFQVAGARSVVASLWSVDDRATQQLMQDFYSLAWDAKGTLSRAEALRKAQLAMLFGRTLDGRPRGPVGELVPEKGTTRRVPPYYWAAFVLSGDWR